MSARSNFLKGELSQIESEQAAAFELHKRGVSLEFIGRKMAECDAKIVELKNQIDAARHTLSQNTEAVNRYYESADRLHDLIAHLRDHSGDEVYKQRSLVAARLKAVIDKVIVAPARPKIYKGDKAEILDLANFEVCFRNGISRIVHPDPANPLKFVRQVYGTASQLDIIEPDGRRYPMDDGYDADEVSA